MGSGIGIPALADDQWMIGVQLMTGDLWNRCHVMDLPLAVDHLQIWFRNMDFSSYGTIDALLQGDSEA